MSLITHHWSATDYGTRLRDYHVEYAVKSPEELSVAILAEFSKVRRALDVDWSHLLSHFKIYKNFEFDTSTTYGTYEINHDPRDQSPDIEVGALCMGGEHTSITGSWGAYPFTIAHAWLAVGITARIAKIKNIDIGASFDVAGNSLYINGPLNNVSTHAERAWQTVSSDAKQRPDLGYFIYSGDPDCRWDLAVLDETDKNLLSTPLTAVAAMRSHAQWIRTQAHMLKEAGISDLWDLDKGVTP